MLVLHAVDMDTLIKGKPHLGLSLSRTASTPSMQTQHEQHVIYMQHVTYDQHVMYEKQHKANGHQPAKVDSTAGLS